MEDEKDYSEINLTAGDETAPAEKPDLFEKEYVIEDADSRLNGGEEEDTQKEKKEKKKGPKKGLLIALIALLVAGGAFAGWYFLRPQVKFTTMRPVAEAGGKFDPLSIIKDVQGGTLSEVKISGPEGELAKGVYKYYYIFRNHTSEVTVTVKDTTAPKLSLKESLEFTDRDEIKPEDFVEAEDAGKVTMKMNDQGNNLKMPGMYEVIVDARDEDGNSSTINATLTIVPYDTEGPVIKGAENTAIILGSSFDFKAGVTVTDNKDPNPVLVVDAGGFNSYVEGVYTVKYTARDESGNETVVNRLVSVYSIPLYTPGSDPNVYWDATGEWAPYLVAVNRSHCTVTVYGKDGNGNYTVPVKAFPCSTARSGYNTPISTNVPGGRFHSAWRADWCYMVDGSWGRYAISIDTSLAPNEYDRWGIMFHSVCYFSQSIDDIEYEEYNKLGGPASLGCIRLCVAHEKWLYDNCPEGFPIIIYDDPSSPGPLGKPDPVRIDVNDPRRGWDPTDPDPGNPWRQ